MFPSGADVDAAGASERASRLRRCTRQDETKIVTGGMAKTLQIFDLHRPDAEPQILSPQCSDSIKTALYRPCGNTIVSADEQLLRYDMCACMHPWHVG